MIRIGNIEEAWQVLEAIPEFDQRRSLAQLQERLPAGALILIAEADGEPVGCKLGYGADDGSLYSWPGRRAARAPQGGAGAAPAGRPGSLG